MKRKTTFIDDYFKTPTTPITPVTQNNITWSTNKTLLICKYTTIDNNAINTFDNTTTKIASFDLDKTITTTLSGQIYHKHSKDYKFVFDKIPEIMKELSKTHQIIIISNQGGIL